jgi:hypothetical protein
VLRVFAAILGKRLPDIVLLVGKVSLLIVPDVSLVAGFGLYQFSFRHLRFPQKANEQPWVSSRPGGGPKMARPPVPCVVSR